MASQSLTAQPSAEPHDKFVCKPLISSFFTRVPSFQLVVSSIRTRSNECNRAKGRSWGEPPRQPPTGQRHGRTSSRFRVTQEDYPLDRDKESLILTGLETSACRLPRMTHRQAQVRLVHPSIPRPSEPITKPIKGHFPRHQCCPDGRRGEPGYSGAGRYFRRDGLDGLARPAPAAWAECGGGACESWTARGRI